MQRLDRVGESPTGATEAVTLRTAGVLARSNSTTNRIMNLEQILDGKKIYFLALAAQATRLGTANGIVPMPTPAPANPPSATRILHSRARRAAAGEDARAPFHWLRTWVPMFPNYLTCHRSTVSDNAGKR
jgi:hypothetical protein